MPQAAKAYDQRPRVGAEQGQTRLDGVVGGERRVGQRGGVARVEVAERHQQASVGHEQVLGHAAVAAQAAAPRADVGDAFAEHLAAFKAGRAAPAAPGAVDGDRVADPPAAHAPPAPSAATQPALSCPRVNGGRS